MSLIEQIACPNPGLSTTDAAVDFATMPFTGISPSLAPFINEVANYIKNTDAIKNQQNEINRNHK